MKNLELSVVSQRTVDLNNFNVSDVNIYDIAIPLSNQCRYNGQIIDRWSVLSHSVLAHKLFQKFGMADYHSNIDEIIILLHDAAEAYVGDIIFPLKKNGEFHFFDELEERILLTILEACGIEKHHYYERWPVVKKYDKLATYVEARHFFKHLDNFDNFFINTKEIKDKEIPDLCHVNYCNFISMLMDTLDDNDLEYSNSLFECPDSIKPYIECCFVEDDDD